MAHDHSHGIDPHSGDRRVVLAVVANLLLTVAQVVGGVLSGSLALVADALHNFSDVAALLIAFAARRIARRPADEDMTFGYRRIEVVAALVNYTTLVVIGCYLVYEGALRLVEPPEVSGWVVVALGGAALAVDALTAGLTWSMQKGSVNIRALFVHNLSDALASVAVIIGGALMLLFGWWLVDPLVTLGIAGYILYLACSEVGGVIRTLMLGSPPGLDHAAVLHAVNPAALDHCMIGHVSAEPGHMAAIEKLGKTPLLALGMRLGEGTGAALAAGIVKAAAQCHSGMATFAQAGVADKG